MSLATRANVHVASDNAKSLEVPLPLIARTCILSPEEEGFMKYERHFVRAAAARLFSAILLVAMAGTAATQEAPKIKKFLTKPLVIEDQGSFFIGGVPKVTNYATSPAPGAPNQAPVPNQITIGQ